MITWKIIRRSTAIVLIGIPLAACSIGIFVLSLAGIEYATKNTLDTLGFEFTISEGITRAILTLGGALSVGCLALFGVHRQNLSAERRHKVDSSLALRKEIFLQVAEAASMQYQFLLSFASPDVTETERKLMTEKIGAAFFRLQVVASQETIDAMLEANEAWTRAMFSIRALGPTPQRFEDSMTRLIEIQAITKPFMEKHWSYNTIAREEIESTFSNPSKYKADMGKQYSRIATLIEEIKKSHLTN
jgi:hypothetical protein